jgi:hypothetical protein
MIGLDNGTRMKHCIFLISSRRLSGLPYVETQFPSAFRTSAGRLRLMSPYITPPLQRRGVTTCKDHQEVARSALVNGIESKMAALI